MNNAENIFSKYINLEKGKIRIGGGNSLVNSLIINPMLEFIKKYPDIDIAINSGITDSLIQKLANGELDLVVLNLPFDLYVLPPVAVKILLVAIYPVFVLFFAIGYVTFEYFPVTVITLISSVAYIQPYPLVNAVLEYTLVLEVFIV